MNYDPRRWQGFGDAAPQMSQPGPMQEQQKPRVNYIEDWFTYQTSVALLLQGSTAITNIQLDADSDFVLTKLTGSIKEDGADTFVDPDAAWITILMVDSGSGRQLMNNPVPWGATVGSGQLPYVLPQPRIFKARSNIALTFANFSTGTDYNVFLSLAGRKVFAQGQPPGGMY